MKNIFLFIVCFTASGASVLAQSGLPEETGGTEFHTFGNWSRESKTAVIFADVCNIRKAADPKAEVAGKLMIGTPVQILEISSVKFTQNGIRSPWVKVKSADLTGYVWGGLLTNASVTLGDGSMVVWGVIGKKENDDEVPQITASVRVARNGALISKHDFLVKHGSNPEDGSLGAYPAPKLPGVKNVLVFRTLSEACGVYASSHYFLLTETGLHFIGSGYSMGDGGQLHTSKSYVFPYETQGNYDYHYTPSEGHIFCIENDGGYNEACEWVETYKVKDFLWKDFRLEKSCED